MVTLTYADLSNVLKISVPGDESIANLEYCVIHAIDLINLYANTSISNLSGASGSMTCTVTERERGAIILIARAIYDDYFGPQQTVNTEGLGIVPVSLMLNPTFERLLKRACRVLVHRSFLRT